MPRNVGAKFTAAVAIALTFLFAIPETSNAQPGRRGARTQTQRGQTQAKPTDGQPIPADWAEKVEWRSIGPANMSGRITALAVYEKDPTIWWAASASGGLLKTTNNGVDFEHQFDDQATVSIGDVQVAQSDPNIVWVGTGESNPRNSVSWGDGVYKSTDGGKTWKNMGLKKTFQTGALAIHPTNPDVVYVGSLGRLWGPNPERGLFKTTDGGKTWKKKLYIDDKTGVVDVQINPKNPDEVLIATYERKRDGFDGNDPEVKYGPGSGIYKTTDGGQSFMKVSKGLPTCHLGRIGLDYYRKNPKFVYAIVESEKIAKQPEDQPFAGLRGENADVGAKITNVTASGPADKAGVKTGDIVVSVDGAIVMSYNGMLAEVRKRRAGDTVKLVVSRDRKQVAVDLKLGKIQQTGRRAPRSPFTGTLGGQAANLQDQQGEEGFEYGGVYMSADGGTSWKRVNTLNPRPMYYSHIRVDPSDKKNVYVCGTSLYRSFDGGKTFTGDGGSDGIHVDHHALWIDARDSRHMILGNDGGIFVTHDRMEHWDHHNHIAIGQFYHVGVDAEMNYRVYGGLQDNGSWGGPSQTHDSAGSVNSDWYRVGGGDGFITLVDPNDKDQIYFESQNGGMGRINLRTGERGFIRPRAPRGTRYRFNWKTPFMLSPHNSKVFYSAGNYVFQSFKKGDGIKAISPEITNTNRGAGSAITESPVEPGVLYAGTTDGALWMTRNGGRDWSPLFLDRKSEKKAEEAKEEKADDKKSDEVKTSGEETSDKKTDADKKSDMAKDPITGVWEGRMISDRIPEDRAGISFTLKMGKDSKFTGEMENRRSGDMEEFEGMFNAETGAISWVMGEGRREREYDGKVKNGKMTGQMVAGGGRFEVEFEATRKKKDPQNRQAQKVKLTLSKVSTVLLGSQVNSSILTATRDEVSGNWKGVVEGDGIPGGRIEYTVELKMDAKNQISGMVVSPMGEVEITEGSFNPESKAVLVHAENDDTVLDFSGKISGDTCDGELEINEGAMTLDFSWTREKKAAAEEMPEGVKAGTKAAADSSSEGEKSEAKDSSEEASASEEETDDAEAKGDDPISGEWAGELESPRGSQEITVTLNRKSDKKITGMMESRMGETEITEGAYNPETKSLTLHLDNERFEMDFDGQVENEKFTGQIEINGGAFSMDFDLQRKSKAKPAVAASESDDDDASDAEAAKKEVADKGKSDAELKSTSNLGTLMPGPRWVSSLEASRFRAGRCYVTFDGHRSNDDAAYLFVTENYGKTWKSIKANLPATTGSARVLREDVENENLLYLGCEFSSWFSVDRGKSWTRFSGLPTVSVHEFAVHPIAGEVVAGTHGRALWIADVTLLRQLASDSPAEAAKLYKPKDVIRWQRSQLRGDNGPREFHGTNPTRDAQISYSLGRNARGVNLEILDLRGNLVYRFEDAPTSRGLHVLNWDMRRSGGGNRFGAGVPSGNYLVNLEVGTQKFQQVLSIKADPTAAGSRTAEEIEFDFFWDAFIEGGD